MNRNPSPLRLWVEKPLYVLVFLVLIATILAYYFPIDIAVRTRGVVRAKGDAVRVVSEEGGRIREIRLQEGGFVYRGDILIELDSREVELKKRSLESKVAFYEQRLAVLQQRITDTAAIEERAAGLDTIDNDATRRTIESSLRQAQLRFTRSNELFTAGLLSRQAFDESRTALSQAQAEHLRLAARSFELKAEQTQARLRDLAAEAVPLHAELAGLRHQLEQVEIERDRLRVISPCDGQVTFVAPLHVAEILPAGTVVAALTIEPQSFVVESWISTSDRSFVNVGQPAQLQIETQPSVSNNAIEGMVFSISPDATLTDSQHAVFKTRIVPSLSHGLRLGMTLQVHIITRQERLLWLLFQRIRQGFVDES